VGKLLDPDTRSEKPIGPIENTVFGSKTGLG